MNNPRLAGRYAKSLLDLATEQSQVDAVYADMKWLHSICKSNPDFVNMLRSPVIKPTAKGKIIESVSKERVSKLTTAFIQLLVSKAREINLPEIVTAFIAQYKENKGIHTVKLTTAVPVSEELKQSILQQIRVAKNMQHLELNTEVNEDLIGGYVLEIGDELVDASIAFDLHNIKKQFENNDFVYKIR